MNRRWSRAAAAHLESIRTFIAKDNLPAAERTVAGIIRATERLELFPKSGRPGSVEGTREIVVAGLPYLVIYEVRGGVVEIHGVFHTFQDRQK